MLVIHVSDSIPYEFSKRLALPQLHAKHERAGLMDIVARRCQVLSAGSPRVHLVVQRKTAQASPSQDLLPWLAVASQGFFGGVPFHSGRPWRSLIALLPRLVASRAGLIRPAAHVQIDAPCVRFASSSWLGRLNTLVSSLLMS